MKKRNILLLSIVAGFMMIGRLQTVASEIYETDNGISVELETFEKQELEEINSTENQIEDVKKDSDGIYYQGLIYYCNRYQYECEAVYLQKYLEYMNLEVDACKEMYNMGEITAADLKSYQAKQALTEAQITVAKNQRDYNDLFLKENNLDYSNYVIKEEKDVKSVDDYVAKYPGKNHMTMAGYVIGYHDALAYIGAKEIEIDALATQLDAAKLLYDAGEISKMEFKQQEVAAAKAQYELEQYYVEMNLAYINLLIYTREQQSE